MNMFDKDNLRKESKNIRKTLDMKFISKGIVENIRELEAYRRSKRVMLFYPLKNEVDLLDLLKDDKFFYLPRVNGEELECCPYKQGDELVMSDFKVLEPVCESVPKSDIDLVLVPALCVDNNCNRLGYGKGFYDRFLSDYKGVSVIVIPDELVFSEICKEKHDRCCDYFITQKKASFDRG